MADVQGDEWESLFTLVYDAPCASVESLEAALALGCTTYVTGNALSPCTIAFVRHIHDAFRARAKTADVAIIDGTHYGTKAVAARHGRLA
ncbi:MAG: hypothetical protein Q8L14_24375 [Myxococcales bacterium]|nr:hypothetical protein [Myxococcales bacterium]